MSDKKPIFVSASRAETFKNCSQLYAARYIFRLPDKSNDGANRGSVAHDVLELLAKPRHKNIYSAAIHHDSCKEVPALWRLIQGLARKYNVADEANLNLINTFIMVGLREEFFGPKGTYEDLAEYPFELKIDRGDGRRYAIKGFIDRIFKVKDKYGLLLVTKDFKSSKDVFKGDKVEFNIQSLCYQLAERELFPEFKRREFHFLFLKFPKKARQNQPSFTDDQLDGFEVLLTDLQIAMESFTEENTGDNYAADDPERAWLCGREGTKKDGTPNWICPARLPLDYWVALDENGEIAASAFTQKELKVKEGQTVEQRHYGGCSRYFNPKTGARRNFS